MSKKVLYITGIVLVCSICRLQADVINSTWVGGSQGEWGEAKYWADPNNWDPHVVPDNNGDTFAVTIDSDTGIIQLHLKQVRTIDRLDCYGEVWMYMGDPNWIQLTINEPNGLTNYGVFRLFIHGSEFDRIVGNITNRGVMELKSKIGYIVGNVTNASGAELDLIDLWTTGSISNLADGMIWIGHTVETGNVENTGSIMLLPASELVAYNTLHNTGEIKMNGGFCGSDNLLHNDTDGVIKGFGVVFAEELLQNEGQISAFGGSLTIACEGSFTNTGTLGNMCVSSLYISSTDDVSNQSKMVINPGGGVAFDCNLVNEPNATIQLNGGTLASSTSTITQQAGATFEGFGAISSDVIISPKGIVRLTGPTNIVGDVEIDEDATLEISDGLTLITGHVTCDGTIHMKGGWMVPQGGISGSCNIVWEPGPYSHVADFNLDGQVDFEDFSFFADTWLWEADWR